MPKNNVVTIRLSSDEKAKLDIDASKSSMTSSQYIRTLIMNTEITNNCHQQEVASMLCKIYIMLSEKNIPTDETLMKELHLLCQTLS